MPDDTPTRQELRRWRHEWELTQAGLAELIGFSRDAVMAWESGRRAIPPWLPRVMRDIERELGG